MTRLGRRYRFSAAHRLHSPQLSAEENRTLYGKCNNPFGHGHNYVLEVILRGEPDAKTGLLASLEPLDLFVHETVLAKMDHRYLNEEVEPFATVPPTTENLAVEIRSRLEQNGGAFFNNGVHLDGVRIWETRRNMVEY